MQDMTPIELAKESFETVQGDLAPFTKRFHAALAERAPMAQHMFKRGMLDQADSFDDSLRKTLDRLECPARLILPLRRIGQLHHSHGVTAQHYQIIIDTFVETFAQAAGDNWKPAHEKAWRDLLGFMADTMQSHSRQETQAQPTSDHHRAARSA